jgi:hypothetical protein
MITTRESINYQFSLIFGYSSPNNIVVGDVIGPGKLTKEKVNNLSKEVILYLRMFNAILRDYTGSELYSIEFELFNFDPKDSSLKIYPKSMILTPGSFKDCESLFLALKPETGILNIHKSKESIDEISKLFFDVEEFSNHPELSKDDSKAILQRFASRFSLKLFGEMLEDKWNKKLIGVSASIPTEKKMLDSFSSVSSDVGYAWDKKPVQISFRNSKYKKLPNPLEEQASIDHLSYSISPPSANYVATKTLELGTNLMELANIGTTEESQEKIVLFIFNRVENRFNLINESKDTEWIISEYSKLLTEFEKKFSLFLKVSQEFTYSGLLEPLNELLIDYRKNILDTFEGDDFYYDFCDIAVELIKDFVHKDSDPLRSSDLNSPFQYFSELISSTFKLIQKFLPIYLSRLRLKRLFNRLILNLEGKINQEQKPAMILGKKIIEGFESFISSEIEKSPLLSEKYSEYNDSVIINEFKQIIRNNVSDYFKSVNLTISDLVSFAEIQMESDSTLIKEHIEKFKNFSAELHFLLSYILRYSTINRFLKENPENEISDPVTFSNKFYRFLEKRVGGIKLDWKEYILDWIKDYAKKFFNMEEHKSWKLNEIFYDFLNYLETRESKEQEIESFLKFLDLYIAKNSEESSKVAFLEFYQKYDFCQGISKEFPRYIFDKIENELNLLTPTNDKFEPLEIFKPKIGESYLEYLRNKKLKYYSPLIPRPVSLTLIHQLTEKERESFKGDLYHVFNFKYWGRKCNFEIMDNFKEVYRKWLREK